MRAIHNSNDYVRALATASALFYPLYWLFQSVLGIFPALIRAAFGAPLGTLNASPLRFALVGGEPRGSVSAAAWLVIVWVTAGLMYWGIRDVKRRAAIGFALAVWAMSLALSPISSLYRSGGFGIAAGFLLVLALFIAVSGFAWIIPAIGDEPRSRRGLRLALVFVLPVALAVAFLRFGVDYPFEFLGRREIPAATLLAVAAFIVGSRERSLAYPRPEPTWRGAWLGAVATVLVFWGSQQLAQAVGAADRAERSAALAASPANKPLPAAHDSLFFKGVNFTAEWPARYDSEQARATLEALPSFGVNSIALVPYAAARLGSPEIRFPLGMEGDDGIRFMTSVAHAAGMRVLLKPQVWYRGGYPGDQEIHGEADLDAFFANYSRYVEHYAKLAEETHADMFCIGVEFAKLTQYEERWRKVIAVARAGYSGPLTYAANFGEEFESVRFWDALDYIGLDNYYPLPSDLSTREVAHRVEAVYSEFGKPVLFTEVGFTRHQNTYEKPWEDHPGGAESPEMQARCYEAVFEGFQHKPWLGGMFWWKVGSAGADGRDGTHSPWGQPAMDVLKSWYLKL